MGDSDPDPDITVRHQLGGPLPFPFLIMQPLDTRGNVAPKLLQREHVFQQPP